MKTQFPVDFKFADSERWEMFSFVFVLNIVIAFLLPRLGVP